MKTLPTVAVDQCEEVAELHGQLMEALAELKASEAELDQLNRILDPLPASADTTSSFQSEIETLRAHQQLPIAKMRFMEARAAWLELAPRYERARSAAAVRLAEVRAKGRFPLLKKFVAALDAAKDIGEEIRVFDEETVRLGGSAPGHPFGLLLDDLPYRQGFATEARRYLEQLEGE